MDKPGLIMSNVGESWMLGTIMDVSIHNECW